MTYEVIVGNIGTVYSGGFYQSALDAYTVYQRKSDCRGWPRIWRKRNHAS